MVLSFLNNSFIKSNLSCSERNPYLHTQKCHLSFGYKVFSSFHSINLQFFFLSVLRIIILISLGYDLVFIKFQWLSFFNNIARNNFGKPFKVKMCYCLGNPKRNHRLPSPVLNPINSYPLDIYTQPSPTHLLQLRQK